MTDVPHENVQGELAELLGPAALGLLTTAEQERLDRHLAGCAACRTELAALVQVAARLQEADGARLLLEQEQRAPDPAVAVLAAVAREQRRVRRTAVLRQAVLAAAAAVAVLAAGLVAATDLRGDPAPAVPLEAVAVRADSGVRASADLVAHTWGLEIKLVAAGLADGQAYEVRVTTTDGRVVGAGAFLGTGGRTLTCSLNASVLRPDAAAFAVLDARGVPVLSADL